MSGEEKEKPLTTADLKNLVLAKIENLLFEAANLIYQKQADKAIDVLTVGFSLLPPDITSKCEEEELTLQVLKKMMAQVKFLDPFQKLMQKQRIAQNSVPKLLKIIRKIQTLMYENYLRTGWKGVDLTREKLEKPDFEAGEKNED